VINAGFLLQSVLFRKLMDIVLDQISLVEQCPRNHHDLVSQLSENQHHTIPKAIDLPFDGTHSSVIDQGVSDPNASIEYESSGCRNSPSALTTICYAKMMDWLSQSI
jgi:hypothetical protein